MQSSDSLYVSNKHLVVDIETLGVTIPSPVLSIGMALLDCSAGFPATLRLETIQVDPKDCIGSPDTVTVLWWNKQSPQAHKAAFDLPPDCEPFAKFLSIVESFKPSYFWGNSPDFDFGHLEAQLKHRGLPVPWRFWQLRDIRTVVDLGLTEAKGEVSKDPILASPYAEDLLPRELCCEHVAVFDACLEAKKLYATIRNVAAFNGSRILGDSITQEARSLPKE